MSQPIMIRDLESIVDGKLLNCGDNFRIDYISFSSRDVKEGTLFVAIRGFETDGHKYIDDAFSKGAIAVLCEDEKYLLGRVGIVVKDSREALAKISNVFFGNPSSKLYLEGVTGTNGKTTTNWILQNIYSLLSEKTLRLGTLGAYSQNLINQEFSTGMPDPLTIQGILEKAVDNNVTYAVLEYTSQGGTQHRGDCLEYDAGIFTNLTQDHLDYHKTMEEYFKAKVNFFDLLVASPKKNKSAIINIDCPYGKRIFDYLKDKGLNLLSYGSKKEADIYIKDFKQNIKGSVITIAFEGIDYVIESQFIGKFNAYNISAAFGAFVARTKNPQKFVELFSSIPMVPGRLEPVINNHFGIYVDYAHTDDALKNVLTTLRELVNKGNNLWCIFGCGGDRDRTKRPKMAKVVSELADKVVMTMDNPRTEDPNQILSDMLEGYDSPDIMEADRKIATFEVLNQAKEGDVILLAGKGHENYQIFGHEKIHYSDKETVEEILLTL